MILHSYWRSSTSYRIRIALNLKGVSYKVAPVNLKTGEQRSETWLSKNPHGTVPLLDTGTETLTQSLAILDWLDAHHPDPAFLPDTQTALCRDLYYAVATEMHAPLNLGVLNYLRREFEANDAAIKAWYVTWIDKTFAPVEARLAAHSWAGDLPFGQPSLFEIVLIPQIYNARRWGVDLKAYPHLEKIDALCTALDPFKAAHPDTQIDAEGH